MSNLAKEMHDILCTELYKVRVDVPQQPFPRSVAPRILERSEGVYGFTDETGTCSREHYLSIEAAKAALEYYGSKPRNEM
jgi:hypothetical protein